MRTIQKQASKIYQPFAPEIQSAIAFYSDDVPKREIVEGRYIARFAQTPEEIDAALRLRFEVFNLELNEGLDVSFIAERDEDKFDASCHHLIVIDRLTNTVVGTYRVRTLEAAGTEFGFYSAGEFTVEDLPLRILRASMEIGRASIAREHRNSRVLFLLWKGLAMYATYKRKRYFFGCCSLTTQDCAEGRRALRRLVRGGHFHTTLRVSPREDFYCPPQDAFAFEDEEIKLPKLFETYLRIGAKVCSQPAIDREFKTIDFFVIVDTESISERYYKMFFSEFCRK